MIAVRTAKQRMLSASESMAISLSSSWLKAATMASKAIQEENGLPLAASTRLAEASKRQQPTVTVVQNPPSRGRALRLPPAFRIVSGITACPTRRIPPAPCPGSKRAVGRRSRRCVIRARESADFTPKLACAVRVQIVNARPRLPGVNPFLRVSALFPAPHSCAPAPPSGTGSPP